MSATDPAQTNAGWVVVGIDNGGTSNNATVLTAANEFLVDHLVEVPSRVTEGTALAVEAMESALDTVLAVTGVHRSAVRAVGLDTPGPGQRRRRHLVAGLDQLLRRAVVGVRHPRCAGGPAGSAGGLQQRRQRRRAVRAPRALRRGRRTPVVGRRHRGDRSGWWRGRAGAGRARRRRHGRRAGPRDDPDAGPAGAGPAAAAVQLRVRRRRGERRVAHRHREEPAALLAHALPRPPARRHARRAGREVGARVWLPAATPSR